MNRSFIRMILFGAIQLLTLSLYAGSQFPISISTIAESSAGCQDGAIVVKTKPSGQCVSVTVQPGSLSFKPITPAVLRPVGTPGFSAGTYNVKVTNSKGHKLKKCVIIPIARFDVTVPPVIDANCGCNGSFSTIFENQDKADVDVTFVATSDGTIIGTNGVYTDLCPGTYQWTVQATSKSTACNNKVVFKKSGTVIIGGTGPIEKPLVTPTTQTVSLGQTIAFSTSPIIPDAIYTLIRPNGQTSLENSTGRFSIPNARQVDQGSYTVQVTVNDCPPVFSDPVTVNVTTTPCNLTIGLTPLPVCSPSTTGSIRLTFSGSKTGTVQLFVDDKFVQNVSFSPFVITQLLAPHTYTIKIVDRSVTNCSATAITQLEVITPPTPKLSASATCSGNPFTMTVIPAQQRTYTLHLPDGTQRAQQGNNIFTFLNGSAADNGPYFATYVDSNGCMSEPSNVVSLTIQPVPIAKLTPSVEVVPSGGTITFMASPVIAGASYSLFVPNKNRGNPPGIIKQNSPNFTLVSAGSDDAGDYTVVITTADGCVSDPSEPSIVTIGGKCDLSLGLTPVPVCNPTARGSIILTFTGGSGTVDLFVNDSAKGQVSADELPFTIDDLTPDTYTVKIVDTTIHKCSNQATTKLGVVPSITPTLTANAACAGSPINMIVQPANQVRYTLTLPDQSSKTQLSNVFSFPDASPALNGDYFATLVDTNGCNQGPSNTVTVMVNPKPVATLLPAAQTVLEGAPVVLVATTTITSPDTLFILTDPNGDQHTQNNGTFIIAPAIPGNYSVVVVSNGCPSDASAIAEVTVGGCLTFTLTPHPACENRSLGSITVNVASGTAPFSYILNGNPPVLANQSPFSIPNLQGNAFYRVSVTDATGCAGTAGPVFVSVLPVPPLATITPATQNLLLGGTLSFTAGPSTIGENCVFILTTPNPNRGINGVITQTGTEFLLPNATMQDLGSYSLVLDCGGCPSDPPATAEVVLPTCNLSLISIVPTGSCGSPNSGNGSLKITVTGGTAPYFYSADGVTFSDPIESTTFTIVNLPEGTYNAITVKDSTPEPVGPCIVVGSSVMIPEIELPPLSIEGNTFVPIGGTIALTAVAPMASSFAWTGPNNFAASTATIAIPNAAVANSGIYTVTVAADAAECINQASTFVTVGKAPRLLITNGSSKKLCDGDSTSLNVTVKNTGAISASNLLLTDIFPSCITITSVRAPDWTIKTSSSGVRATLSNLGPGQSTSLTVNITLNCSGGKVLESVATVVSDKTPAISATATITAVCCNNACKRK